MIQEKKTKKDSRDEEIKDLTNTLKRVQADFENYKKRNQAEQKEAVCFASKELILKMLPMLDNFELALKNSGNKEEFVKGMELIFKQLHSMLEQEGLKQINALNQKFDPYKHEALLRVESDQPNDTVIEVLQKGYMLNDKVIRHAKVKVSNKCEEKKAKT